MLWGLIRASGFRVYLNPKSMQNTDFLGYINGLWAIISPTSGVQVELIRFGIRLFCLYEPQSQDVEGSSNSGHPEIREAQYSETHATAEQLGNGLLSL